MSWSVGQILARKRFAFVTDDVRASRMYMYIEVCALTTESRFFRSAVGYARDASSSDLSAASTNDAFPLLSFEHVQQPSPG